MFLSIRKKDLYSNLVGAEKNASHLIIKGLIDFYQSNLFHKEEGNDLI